MRLVAHSSALPVPRVIQISKLAGIGACCWCIERRRGPLSQRFMRTFLVVFMTKEVEAALLSATIASRRSH